MKTSTRLFLNDMLTGLLVAASLGAIAPHGVSAQDIHTAVDSSAGEVFTPFIHIVNYIAYAIGTVMVVAGIAHAKKHADNPGSNPLGPALGRLGAGAAFLAAPSVIGMMQGTTTDTIGSQNGTFQSLQGVNVQ